VPNRTHTFASYLSDVVFKGLVPVFVATSVVLQGTYAQDSIVDLATGAELNCGPRKDKCSIKEVYKSNRRADAYTDIGKDEGLLKYFSLKVQNDGLRLMVNMQALSEFYIKLDSQSSTVGGSESGDGRRRKRASKGLSAIEPEAGFWYDPSPADGFDPYPQDMTAEEIRREERQQRQAGRYEAKMSKKEARAWTRYDRWVQKQLGARRKDDVVEMTEQQYEEYYLFPTNKKFPYRFSTDLAGEYGPLGGLTAQGAGVRSNSGAGGGSNDDNEAEAENFSATSFIYDFALILNTVDGLRRLDMTISK
jgi:hypothetical protein